MSAETLRARGLFSARLRLDLAYDGAAFSGWAKQPGLRTVQGVLEEKLAVLFAHSGEETPGLVVAGRTDAGVHATGQVVHLDIGPAQCELLREVRGEWSESAPHVSPNGTRNIDNSQITTGNNTARALVYRLNGLLGAGSDLVIRDGSLAPEGFDARFSALWRRYEYRICDGQGSRDPRTRGFTVWHPRTLDVSAMNTAATSLLGLHDFAAFCKPREGATTVRTLQEFSWSRDTEGVIVARVRADAFCHSMVRALIGLSVAVGEGRLEADDASRLMAARERTSAFKVMPAHGLTLCEVAYPPAEELAARATLTRARRADTS